MLTKLRVIAYTDWPLDLKQLKLLEYWKGLSYLSKHCGKLMKEPNQDRATGSDPLPYHTMGLAGYTSLSTHQYHH